MKTVSMSLARSVISLIKTSIPPENFVPVSTVSVLVHRRRLESTDSRSSGRFGFRFLLAERDGHPTIQAMTRLKEFSMALTEMGSIEPFAATRMVGPYRTMEWW
jgi:hypothetical protein